MKPFYKTAIKDWGAINFIEEKIGKSLPAQVIATIAEKVAKSNPITSIVMDLVTGSDPSVDSAKFSATDMATLIKRADSDQKLIDAEIRLAEIELEKQKAVIDDVANAREAQQFRDTSTNPFIRFFSYLLAITIVGMSFGTLGILVFKAIPETNQTLFNVAFGYIWGAFTTIVAFFFGSSDTDKKK